MPKTPLLATDDRYVPLLKALRAACNGAIAYSILSAENGQDILGRKAGVEAHFLWNSVSYELEKLGLRHWPDHLEGG